MTIDETVKADMTAAMKSGDRTRASALRLVLSELQRSMKDGDGDQQAVLRRERKRRIEAADQFEAAGRPELAAPEREEALMIEAYLPAELPDDQLRDLVRAAVAASGASGPADIGTAMRATMEQVAGRADGKRVNALVREELGG